MKSFALIFVLFLVGMVSFAQECSKLKTLREYDLKGNVKSVDVKSEDIYYSMIFDEEGMQLLYENKRYTEEEFILTVYIKDGKILTKVVDSVGQDLWIGTSQMKPNSKQKQLIWKDSQSGKEYVSEYLFSDAGKLLSEHVIKPSIEEYGEMLNYSCHYSYDINGNLVRKEIKDNISNLITIEEIDYKKNETPKEKIVIIKPTIKNTPIKANYKIKFDKNSNEYERVKISEEGKDHRESKIIYTRESKIKKLKLYDEDGKASIIKNKYSNGKLILSKFKLSSGRDHYVLENTYNSNGDLISSDMQNYITPELSVKTEYNYEYDEQGNWIKKVETIDGIETRTIEREITYF